MRVPDAEMPPEVSEDNRKAYTLYGLLSYSYYILPPPAPKVTSANQGPILSNTELHYIQNFQIVFEDERVQVDAGDAGSTVGRQDH